MSALCPGVLGIAAQAMTSTIEDRHAIILQHVLAGKVRGDLSVGDVGDACEKGAQQKQTRHQQGEHGQGPLTHAPQIARKDARFTCPSHGGHPRPAG
jgi:hypothetical protein